MADDDYPNLIVHSRDPLNAETTRERLAVAVMTDADDFYIRNHGAVPAIDPDEWKLTVGREMELSLAQLRELPHAEVVATFQCAGNRRAGLIAVRDIPGEEPWGPGATGTARWGGVRLSDVLALAGVTEAGSRHVAFSGADVSEEAEPTRAFAESIPLEKALRPEVLLAYEMNGAPLSAVHGAPESSYLAASGRAASSGCGCKRWVE